MLCVILSLAQAAKVAPALPPPQQQDRKALVGNGEWDQGKSANPGIQHSRRIDVTRKNCKLSYISASRILFPLVSVRIFKDVR